MEDKGYDIHAHFLWQQGVGPRPEAPPPASRAQVIAALQVAVTGLENAAERVAACYGQEAPQVAQLVGAARMIETDWLPAIREESDGR